MAVGRPAASLGGGAQLRSKAKGGLPPEGWLIGGSGSRWAVIPTQWRVRELGPVTAIARAHSGCRWGALGRARRQAAGRRRHSVPRLAPTSHWQQQQRGAGAVEGIHSQAIAPHQAGEARACAERGLYRGRRARISS